MFSRSFRSSTSFTTFVVCVAVFTDILLQNLVVPVLPFALHARVGLEDEADIQRWTSVLLAAYGAALMLGSLLFGYVGDLLSSRRTPFVLGLIVVFLSTLAFALATDVWTLLVARVLEGVSTAIVSTIGNTLLVEAVGPEKLGKAMGYTSMALSFGLLIGPVIGGVIYEYCGYFQVYLPAFALIGMEIILRLMMIEKRKPVLRSSPYKIPSVPVVPEDAPPKNATAETEPLLRSASNMQPASAYWSLLTSPRFLVALTALFILNSIACGFDSTLTPFIHAEFNMRATHAAALFLALAVPMLLAPLSGWATDRYGPKLPVAAGLVLAIPALALSSSISANTRSPFAKLAVLFAFIGLALALTVAPLRVEASLVVECMEREKPGRFGINGANGRAFGLVNTMVAAGGLVGPLYAGFVRVTAGWMVLQCVNGALCLGILVHVLLVTGGTRKEEARSREVEV